MPRTFVDLYRQSESDRLQKKRLAYSSRVRSFLESSVGFPTVSDIHTLCDELRIPWDSDKLFMNWTEWLTGKRELDKLSKEEREFVYLQIQRGGRPGMENPELKRLRALLPVPFGGQGSGNIGHAGRPGEVGGSLPKGEGGGQSPGTIDISEGVRVRERLSERMVKGEFTVESTMKKGGIELQFGNVEGGGKSLWKPEKRGQHVERDAAAYEVDRLIGANVVPPTFVREMNGQKGFIQGFAGSSDLKALGRGGEQRNSVDSDDWKRVAVLDYVIDNRDRHGRNLRVAKVGGRYRLRAIDHTMSIGTEFDSSNMLAIQAVHRRRKVWGDKLPLDLEKKVKSLTRPVLENRLGKSLQRDQVDRIWDRVKNVQQLGLSALWDRPLRGYRAPKRV